MGSSNATRQHKFMVITFTGVKSAVGANSWTIAARNGWSECYKRRCFATVISFRRPVVLRRDGGEKSFPSARNEGATLRRRKISASQPRSFGVERAVNGGSILVLSYRKYCSKNGATLLRLGCRL
jgi:hypothetical protein